MAKEIRVEYVCTGNNGRSPVAETSAKHRLLTYPSFSDTFHISSRGINVDNNLRGTIPSFDFAYFLLERGLQHRSSYRGIYADDEACFIKDKVLIPGAEVRYQENTVFRNIVSRLALRTRKLFAAKEGKHRKRFLNDCGLSYNGHSKQFRPREDVQYVFGMDEGHIKSIKSLCDEQDIQPHIELLSTFVGGAGDFPPNAYGNPDQQVHNVLFAHIKSAAEKSIDRVVELEGLK